MKKITLMIFSFITLISCSNEDKSHIETAKNFSESATKGKITEAKKYATESTGKLLDLVIASNGHNAKPNFEFEFIKDSISENNAWVKFKDKNGTKKSEEIHLIKVDGIWLVNLSRKQKRMIK